MDTFERKEIKYLLTPMQYLQFRALAEQHLAPAEYHDSLVSSVYYDTADDLLINRSIQGGKYKEKLRVRSYGADAGSPDSPVFVEIKKKFKGITYKRRVNCTQAAADAFLGGMDYLEAIERWPLANAQAQEAAHSRVSLQIAGEIAWMRDHYEGITPKMRVSTHRLSFVDVDDPALRITFDADARWQQVGRHVPSMLGAGASAQHNLFAEGEHILEIKCSQAYPMWLVAVLNECGVRPQSVSKYGLAYKAAMISKHSIAA
ncbi:MAG: polyphosphate polymerase domain-containing protein [Coriobacteriia bacterium]|nr:polyphosphate polymerase domain-containing protein [Coriobacteriia bacterium]